MDEMENARTAMSIGEFARRVALSVSALRFYDECGLLRPAAVEASTGYRFYDESQIGVAELVRDLRQLRLPVARVRELLELPADARHQAVERQVEALTAELAAALEAARVLHRRIDLLEGDMTITVNGAELADGLRHAIAAAGTDDERPALKAVLIEAKNGSVRLVATDSFRLTIRDLVNQAGVGDSLRTLVDASRLSEAVEWIAEQDSVELKANGALVLRAAGSERSLPTVAGPYPEYEGILDVQHSDRVAVVAHAALIDALESLEGDGMRVVLGADRLDLSASGESRSVPAQTQGNELEVFLNRSFVHDAVRAAVGPDIAIEASDPLQPVMFRSADTGTAVTLVMPIKATDS